MTLPPRIACYLINPTMKPYFTFLLSFLAMLITAARGERPNIIMFLIDDQNPSSIAAFGGDTYTPNLDRMAEEGMKFTRAYVSSSVCTPSRYSFLTGRFAGNSHSKLYADAVGGRENQGLPNASHTSGSLIYFQAF